MTKAEWILMLLIVTLLVVMAHARECRADATEESVFKNNFVLEWADSEVPASEAGGYYTIMVDDHLYAMSDYNTIDINLPEIKEYTIVIFNVKDDKVYGTSPPLIVSREPNPDRDNSGGRINFIDTGQCWRDKLFGFDNPLMCTKHFNKCVSASGTTIKKCDN
jgi:hypothetical protein